MTARALALALGLSLLSMVALRAFELLDYRGAHFLEVEMSLWEDDVFGGAIEHGIGGFLAQEADQHLLVDYIDKPMMSGEVILRRGQREVSFHSAPSADELRPVLAALVGRVGEPTRLHVVATDHVDDQLFSKSVETIASERSWPIAHAAAVGDVTATVGEWVVVAREAGRTNLKLLLGSPAVIVAALPPTPAALARPHPRLWFIAPWSPDVEYLADGPVSTCAVWARWRRDSRRWSLNGHELRTVMALAALADDRIASPHQVVLPLTLVGPPPGGRGSAVAGRPGAVLPACR